MAFSFAADTVLSKVNVICLPQFNFEVASNKANNPATETILKYKNKHYTMLEKKILRVRKSERPESAVNLKFEFENIPLTIQLISKNVPRLSSSIATESIKNSVRYIFVLDPLFACSLISRRSPRGKEETTRSLKRVGHENKEGKNEGS